MALAVAQILASSRSSATSITRTYASPVAAGTLLVAHGAVFNGSGAGEPAVSDSVNGAWAGYATGGYFREGDANSQIYLWSFPNSGAGTPQVTMDPPGTSSDNDVTLFAITGAATASPRDISQTAKQDGTPDTNAVVTTGTLAQADELLISSVSHTSGNYTLTEDTADGFSLADKNESNSTGQTFLVQYKIVAATTSVIVNATLGTAAGWFTGVAGFKQAPAAATTEQEGYRWRADDGDEDAATWKAAQDTAITAPADTPTRLRVLVDTANADPAAILARLDYKQSTEAASLWRPLGTGLPGAMPAYAGTGQAAIVATATITTQLNPAKPSTVNAGDLLILQVLARNDNNNGAGPATIADWTAFPGNPYGGTNNSRQSLYWRIAGAGEASQTVAVTCTGGTTNDLAAARIYRFTAANGFAAAPIEAIAVNAGTASPLAAPASVTPTGTNRRAVCFGAIASSDATIGSMTGETAGDWTEAVTANTTTGGDGTLNVQTADASAGTAISGGSIAFTLSTSAHWNTVGCCLVPASLTPAMALAASAHIAAGGENTTSQLTAPASGSTFGGGRIQDDENPADSVDLAINQHGEWEWCLAANSAVVSTDEVYQFRVTNNGTALDTYTVTPSWTIGTGDQTLDKTATAVYRLLTTPDTTKSGAYRVLLADQDAAETSAYRIARALDAALGSVYRVLATPDATQGSAYRVQVTDAHAVEATYRLVATVDVEKTGQYAVITADTDQAVQAVYAILAVADEARTAQYAVTVLRAAAHAARYVIEGELASSTFLEAVYRVLVSQEAARAATYRLLISDQDEATPAAYRAQVTSSAQETAVYRLLTTLDRALSAAYEVVVEVEGEQTREAVYRVLVLSDRTRAATYRVLTTVEVSTGGQYALIQADSDATRQAMYLILQALTVSHGGVYRVISPHNRSVASRYVVPEEVLGNVTHASTYRIIMTRERGGPFDPDVFDPAFFDTAITARYRLRIVQEAVETALYHVRATSDATRQAMYALSLTGMSAQTSTYAMQVARDRALAAAYRVPSSFDALHAAAYRLLSTVSSAQTSAYALRVALNVPANATYRILAEKTLALTGRYVIEGELGAELSREATYRILTTINPSLAATYRTLVLGALAPTSQYATRVISDAAHTARYVLTDELGAHVALQALYRVRSVVEGQQASAYRLLSEDSDLLIPSAYYARVQQEQQASAAYALRAFRDAALASQYGLFSSFTIPRGSAYQLTVQQVLSASALYAVHAAQSQTRPARYVMAGQLIPDSIIFTGDTLLQPGFTGDTLLQPGFFGQQIVGRQ